LEPVRVAVLVHPSRDERTERVRLGLPVALALDANDSGPKLGLRLASVPPIGRRTETLAHLPARRIDVLDRPRRPALPVVSEHRRSARHFGAPPPQPRIRARSG